jgi:hypothetical protein
VSLFLGFQDFLICNKIVSSKSEIPSRTTLSPINLNKIYDVCYQKTKDLLKLLVKFPTITCDIWCDKYKHRSYICFTIHFLDRNLQYHHYSLKTLPFDESHTGEAIKDLALVVLHEFGINSNNIIGVREIVHETFLSCFCFSLCRFLIKVQTCVKRGDY